MPDFHFHVQTYCLHVLFLVPIFFKVVYPKKPGLHSQTIAGTAHCILTPLCQHSHDLRVMIYRDDITTIQRF